ncbi:MAG: lipocalin family protein [Flavobacteriaceae bacterium]|nr:lipocalin family protein [Flavobacteriaceae bacterium]
MKKLILLFSVFALMLTSCNKDNDTPSQDSFIGTWTYYKSFENDVEIELSDCDLQDTIQVNADGTFSFSDYDDFAGPCELDFSGTGTWENVGDGNYSTTIDGETSVVNLTFEGNTFYFEEVDEDITYREVYIRN